MKPVLIGMCTYNHYNFTYLALESLYRNTPMLKDGVARLVIIDNNSVDGTVESIKKDFPWVKNILISDRDCISYQWNTWVDMLEPEEDFLMVPNDVVFGPNWLELLIEDTYKYPNVMVGSPYLPCDLAYDEKINEDWANKYKEAYPSIRQINGTDKLKRVLDGFYEGDFDKFCLDFQERNKNEPPIDCAVTHVLLFKNELFKKHNFRFSEEYCPYYGSMEFDFVAELNNLGYYRIASSRSYCHHWVSIANQDSDIELNEKQKIIAKNNLHLLKKWTPIPGSQTYLDCPRPSRIPHFRMPYYKFKKRDPLQSDEEAKKKPGIKFLSFEGLTPGVNYFAQIQPGSILRLHGWSYKVLSRDGEKLRMSWSNLEDKRTWSFDEDQFLQQKWHIDYYFRREEENYYGGGHMDGLLYGN